MAPRAHLRTDGGHVCTTGKQAELTPSQHPGHPAMGTRLAPTFGSKVRKLLEAWCLSPCSDADAPHCAPVHPQHHTGGVWCVGGIAGRKGVCGGGHSHVFGPGLGEGWVATSLLLTPMCGACTHPSRNARASSPGGVEGVGRPGGAALGRQGGLVWCAWRGAREGWCVVSAHVLVSMPHVGKWGYRHAVHMHSTRTTYCRCFACRGPWSACLRAWACTTCGGVHMAGGTWWACAHPMSGDPASAPNGVAAPAVARTRTWRP